MTKKKKKTHPIDNMCTVSSLGNENKWRWARTTVSALQRRTTAWQLVSDWSKDSFSVCVGGYTVKWHEREWGLLLLLSMINSANLVLLRPRNIFVVKYYLQEDVTIRSQCP